VDPRLEPIDERTLLRLLRFACRKGAERVHLRAGFRPVLFGPRGACEITFRQLARDDTAAAADVFLARARVPARLAGDTEEGAAELALWWEDPGRALFEARFAPDGAAGFSVLVDVIRAARPSDPIEHAEP
jgi:hypothetical protein